MCLFTIRKINLQNKSFKNPIANVFGFIITAKNTFIHIDYKPSPVFTTNNGPTKDSATSYATTKFIMPRLTIFAK